MSATKKLFLVFTEIGCHPPKLYKRQNFAQKIIQKDHSFKIRQFENQLSASNAMLIYQMQHQKFLLDEKKKEIQKKIGNLNQINNVQSGGLEGENVKSESEEGKFAQLMPVVNNCTLKEEKKQQKQQKKPINKGKKQLPELQAIKQSLYKLSPVMEKILVHYTPTKAQIPINPEKTYTGFFDGCSKFNPGPSGAGYYITDQEEVVLGACWPLGNKTNNQAEFTALLYLLVDAYANDIRNINIFGDSKLVIDISRGKMRASHQNITEYAEAVNKVLKLFDYKKLQFIERKYNSKADKLSNEALKKRFDAEKEKSKKFQIDNDFLI